MSKTIRWLALLLGAQLLFAGGVFLASQFNRAETPSEPILGGKLDHIDKLVIEEENNQVGLIKGQVNWYLDGENRLPVDESKLTGLLDNLRRLHTGWPVSTTESSHQRFKVAEASFNKKVTLYQDGKVLETLFIGTSPGYKKSHVRVSGGSSVYALALNSYDILTTKSQWFDKKLLAVAPVKSIKGEHFELVKQGEDWTMLALDADQKLNLEHAKSLAKAFETLSVLNVVEEALTFDQEKQITFDLVSDTTYQFVFYQHEGKQYVKRSDRPEIFTLSQHDYSRIAEIKRDKLLDQPSKNENKNERDDHAVDSSALSK